MTNQETRRCGRCGEVRTLDMFYVEMERRRAEREGRTSFRAPCRICQREKNTAYRRERQEYVDRVKVERGCSDCGIRLPDHPEVYDFDHIGDDKTSDVARLLTKGTWEALLEEIAKCEVVCANCHRIRTRRRPSGKFGRSRA